MTWARRAVVASLFAVVGLQAPVVHAASLLTSAVSCTFDAAVPLMNTKKQISGSTTFTCRNASKSLQYITARVVVYEYQSSWNGVYYDVNTMGDAFVASKIFSVKAGSSASFSLATSYKTCIDIKETREDYGTLVTLSNNGTSVTTRDYVPDGYAC